MKNVPENQEMLFEDLPLFRVSRHRQIWESLPRQARQQAMQLVSDLLQTHVVSNQTGGKKDE